ncbi:hypothetical protein Cadr_000012265 [Camelus dromedarius]|uniref:Uncharacterized protein n=1 Tax=Camelus dromedarius TaxID=9838 RepID=A0A5N4DUD9_CAMDR|nr:hypothetical protein Cadr_000012265 [Camelus dromedarius]
MRKQRFGERYAAAHSCGQDHSVFLLFPPLKHETNIEETLQKIPSPLAPYHCNSAIPHPPNAGQATMLPSTKPFWGQPGTRQ